MYIDVFKKCQSQTLLTPTLHLLTPSWLPPQPPPPQNNGKM